MVGLVFWMELVILYISILVGYELDVFKQKIWYFYEEKPFKLIELSLKEVNKIIKQNENGKSPDKIKNIESNSQQNQLPEGDLNRFNRKIK